MKLTTHALYYLIIYFDIYSIIDALCFRDEQASYAYDDGIKYLVDFVYTIVHV